MGTSSRRYVIVIAIIVGGARRAVRQRVRTAVLSVTVFTAVGNAWAQTAVITQRYDKTPGHLARVLENLAAVDPRGRVVEADALP